MFAIVVRLPQYIRLSFRLLTDPRVRWHLKLFYIGILVYVASPFDLIPEAILPPLGYAEDIVLYLVALHNLVKFSPTEVVEEHVQRMASKHQADPPGKSV